MPASLEVAHTRHAAHYASVMEALRDEYLAVADRDHALDRLELDWEQIRVAQSWAAGLGPAGTDGDVDLARRFGQYADPLVRLRHRPDVLRAWLAPLVADDVASRDPATAAENLNRIGMAHYDSGEYAQARAVWLRALATHRRLGSDADPRYLAVQEAGYQANLGSAEERLGERGSAREAYERALEVFRRVGLTQQVGRMWLNLGTLLDAEDAHDEA